MMIHNIEKQVSSWIKLISLKCEKIRDFISVNHKKYMEEKKENKYLDVSIHYENFFD